MRVSVRVQRCENGGCACSGGCIRSEEWALENGITRSVVVVGGHSSGLRLELGLGMGKWFRGAIDISLGSALRIPVSDKLVL